MLVPLICIISLIMKLNISVLMEIVHNQVILRGFSVCHPRVRPHAPKNNEVVTDLVERMAIP